MIPKASIDTATMVNRRWRTSMRAPKARSRSNACILKFSTLGRRLGASIPRRLDIRKYRASSVPLNSARRRPRPSRDRELEFQKRTAIGSASRPLAKAEFEDTERAVATVSLTVNYLRPVSVGRTLVAEARIKSGRRVVSCEIEVCDDRGESIASGLATILVRSPRA